MRTGTPALQQASSTENREYLQSAKREQVGTEREGASAKTDVSLRGGRGEAAEAQGTKTLGSA